jgi:hypothetical protein
MNKTTQSKSKTKSETKPVPTAVLNTPKTRTLVIELNEMAYSLLSFVAKHDGPRTVEQHVRHCIAGDVNSLINDVEETYMHELFGVEDEKRDATKEAASNGTHQIVLNLSEKAWRILDGHVASQEWDNAEHMILSHTSSFLAQAGEDQDEKEYAKIFGLKVDKNGDTRLT